MTLHKRKFAILFLICHIVCFTESRYRDRDVRKAGVRDKYSQSTGLGGYQASLLASTKATVNLCSRDRDMKLMCHCTPDDTASNQPVTKADCYIFLTDFYQNDSSWQAFSQHQNSLKHLKFRIQPTGFMNFIPTKYLSILTNLSTLNIEYAQILEIKSFAFGNLSNLEELEVIHSEVEVIDHDAFANHVSLKQLNLQNNQIVEIDRFAFRNLPDLEKLILTKNNISILHEGVFGELLNLSELKLDLNIISVLTRDMFKGLGNLKSLKLSRNSLNFIGDTVFAELWSLQELELDDNRIERISERALDGLNNLKTLNLRNNRLKKLDNGVLRGVPALLSINLQDNSLETLTSYNMQPIMDNLVNRASELSVSDNKFICDCRLSWVFDLRNRTKNSNIRNSLEEIVCKINRKDGHLLPPLQTEREFLSNVVDQLPPSMGNSYTGTPNVRRNGGAGYANSPHHASGLGAGYDSLQSVTNNHHHHESAIDIDSNESSFDSRAPSFYDDEAPPPAQASYDLENGNDVPLNVVKLLKFTAEGLPCPEELSDPTELPLSRESIGMNVRDATNSHSASSRISTGAAKFSTLLAMISSIFMSSKFLFTSKSSLSSTSFSFYRCHVR